MWKSRRAFGGGVWGSGVVPLVLSGRGEGALHGQAERLRESCWNARRHAPRGWRTPAARRGVFAGGSGGARGSWGGVGGDRGELVEGLGMLAAAEVGDRVVRGVAHEGRPVFVFPGQGSQWKGMALELLVPRRCSLSRWGRAVRRWRRSWIGRWRGCCVGRRVRRRWSGSMWCSRSCSRCSCRWRRCGVRVVCSRVWWWGIRRGRSRRRVWRVVCRWRMRRGWSLCVAGCW